MSPPFCRLDWEGEDVVDVIVIHNEEQLLIVEGTHRQVADAVGVNGAFVSVGKRRKTEDVGMAWRIGDCC